MRKKQKNHAPEDYGPQIARLRQLVIDDGINGNGSGKARRRQANLAILEGLLAGRLKNRRQRIHYMRELVARFKGHIFTD